MANGTATIDYDALAQAHGAVQTSTAPVDYDALAKQHGAISPPVSQTQNPPEQKGFLESLGAGLPGYDPNDSFAAIKDAASGLYHIFTHPVDSANLVFHGVIDPMQLTNEDAIARMKKAGVMNKVNGAIEWAESGVPFIGPQLAKAGQQNEAGNWTGGAGTTLSAALPFVAPSATEGALAVPGQIWSRVSPATSVEEALGRKLTATEAESPRPGGQIQPALNNTPREVLQHASDEGIKLTPGQATEDAMAQNLQKAGTTAAVGGKELTAALRENQVRFGQAVNNFMEDVDPSRSGLSAESAGEAIRDAANAALRTRQGKATAAYNQVRATQQNLSGDLSPLKTLGTPATGEYQAPAVKAAMKDIADAPDRVGGNPSIQSMRNLRSEFIDKGNDFSGNIPDAARAIYKQAAGTVDDQIMTAAKGTQFEGPFRNASALWKDTQQKFNEPGGAFYKILQQKDPTQIVTSLQNAPATTIEALKSEGMDAALEPLRRQVVQDIAKSRFNIGHDGLGGYSDAYLKTLFNPDQVKELYLKADLANRLKYDPNPSGTGANITSVSQLGLWNQTKMSAAAKMSMPRDPLSFLPQQATPAARAVPAVRTTPFPAQVPTVSQPTASLRFMRGGQ